MSIFLPSEALPVTSWDVQATVLLAVDVSFLAIPIAGHKGGAVTVGSIASLCSTVMSVGCIVIGLLLVNEERTDPKTSWAVSRIA